MDLRSVPLSGCRALRRFKNRMLNLIDSPVVVLLYHRVSVLPSDPHRLAVSPENFRAQMRYLKGDFRLLRFEDDWSGLKEPAVAVTFDDGYADNFVHALPILEEVGVPATFFVSTATLGTGDEFWWDELERLVLGGSGCPPSFRLGDREHGRSWPTTTPEERSILHDELHRLALAIDPRRREGWLEQLRAWGGGGGARETHRSLTEGELKSLASSPWVTIGGHTVSHTPLSSLSEEEQRQEIGSSRQRLEEMLGTEIRVFSYPFGNREHYDRTSIRLCREAGFFRAASNFPGQAHRWTDPYQIPRRIVRNWDVNTFADRMKSFWC